LDILKNPVFISNPARQPKNFVKSNKWIKFRFGSIAEKSRTILYSFPFFDTTPSAGIKIANSIIKNQKGPWKRMDQYNSVEFSSDKLSITHQFEIREIEQMPMCILVREDSSVLSQIKTGDILDMRYNCRNSRGSAAYQKTAIRHIIKKDKGRFKGHYLVGLEILENQW
jgi:hypothetical protein